MKSALILTLHGIKCKTLSSNHLSGLSVGRYVITLDCFQNIVNYLQSERTCTVSGVFEEVEETYVILTFDDGLISDFEVAFPILKEKGIKGTFFITVNNIGRKGYCDVTQLRKMADEGMEIGSHGLTHQYLNTLSRSEVIREICESRKILRDTIGVEVSSFAAVGGHYSNWMCKIAQEAGYRTFASMIPGKTRITGRTFLLRRNHIQEQHDKAHIIRLIEGDRRILLFNLIRYYSLKLPKIILGMNNYDYAKRLLLRSGFRTPQKNDLNP